MATDAPDYSYKINRGITPEWKKWYSIKSYLASFL
jgi:hypothetical protein